MKSPARRVQEKLLPLLTGGLCLLFWSAAPVRADFQAVQKDLEQSQPINLDTSCSVLASGATKIVCRIQAHPAYALLVGNTGQQVLESEAKTIDVLKAEGVFVPDHGDIFPLTSFSVKKGLKEKSWPSMLETWIPGTEIVDNLRNFNSLPADFWKTTLGQAAQAQGVGVDALKSKTVASLQKYLDFINSNDKYVVDVEMFIVQDGTVFLVDLAGGFGSRTPKVLTWKTQLQNAIKSINRLQ